MLMIAIKKIKYKSLKKIAIQVKHPKPIKIKARWLFFFTNKIFLFSL